MADIVLFGATGYTGRLTAASLHRRGADFAIAGRDPEKLKALAAQVGSPEVHVVDASDVQGLVEALQGSRCLLTCVGPFVRYGRTAVEAAIRAKVNYLDSTGEGSFIDHLLADYDEQARSAGVALAPAMGFDEVPGDLACALAAEGLERPTITVTYALPRTASVGTVRSALGIADSDGPFVVEGEQRRIRAGELERWAPLPDPLGPKKTVSFPLALLRLAPLHLDAASFGTYVSTGHAERLGLRYGRPALKLLQTTTGRAVVERVLSRLPEGPTEEQRARGRWTVLAEARSGDKWRNVVMTGTDVYGLTAETLAAGAIELASNASHDSGVIAPTQVIPAAALRRELEATGVKIDIYAPV